MKRKQGQRPADRRSMLDRRALLGGVLSSLALAGARNVRGAMGASPIDGTWKVLVGHLDSGDELPVYFELEQVGRRLIGRAIHTSGESYQTIEHGWIDGDRFGFQEAYFEVRGVVKGDRLEIEADFERYWPYTNVLNPHVIQVQAVLPKDAFRRFVAHRVPQGSGRFPAGGPLPELVELPPNGLARTPPMIWGAWYGFTTTISDALIRGMARAMVSSGLRDAGYDILNMEVGWPGQRDADGTLHANRKFPDMKGLCDYVHSLGLKVGLCTSPGPYDCTGYTGSLNHEEQDARTWAQWGIDFIKHDACSVNVVHPKQSRRVYQKMGNALRRCGRPIIYGLCQYGEDDVWEWGARVGGNMWRTTGDIADDWESLSEAFEQGRLAPYAGPGGWNDPDYLMVGMGRLSMEEYRTQFSLWCMLAAPLTTSVDLRDLSAAVRSILLHREMIAIDQDPRGVQGRRVSTSGETEIWLKPLQEGHAVALFNRGEKEATVELDTARIGLHGVREARDVWDRRNIVLDRGRYRARVASHGSVVLRLP